MCAFAFYLYISKKKSTYTQFKSEFYLVLNKYLNTLIHRYNMKDSFKINYKDKKNLYTHLYLYFIYFKKNYNTYIDISKF